jgi:RNA polymerase sigma-70 factor (ECF subfamily)
MASSTTADSELIERIQRRDPEGLSAAYDRYSGIAYGLFMRITRDQAVAEDLLQELFLRVWNRAREFDAGKGALGVWIISIARNMGIDYIRSAQARFGARLRPLENVDTLAFSTQPTDAEGVLDSRRAVKAALSNLNTNERKVLELAYFEGCSQTEISKRLNEPLGTVKTWMRTGLLRMRGAMRLEAAQ